MVLGSTVGPLKREAPSVHFKMRWRCNPEQKKRKVKRALNMFGGSGNCSGQEVFPSSHPRQCEQVYKACKASSMISLCDKVATARQMPRFHLRGARTWHN